MSVQGASGYRFIGCRYQIISLPGTVSSGSGVYRFVLENGDFHMGNCGNLVPAERGVGVPFHLTSAELASGVPIHRANLGMYKVSESRGVPIHRIAVTGQKGVRGVPFHRATGRTLKR
jgi:hypothetical protein